MTETATLPDLSTVQVILIDHHVYTRYDDPDLVCPWWSETHTSLFSDAGMRLAISEGKARIPGGGE